MTELPLDVSTRPGADVNAADASGVTPAHLAAARGNMQALEQLLLLGAQPHTRDGAQRAALHHAAAAGHLQCVLLLMAHGADPLAVDSVRRCMGDMCVEALYVDRCTGGAHARDAGMADWAR